MDSELAKTTYTLDAFISYSRKNQEFARKLEKELEKYKPPKELDVPQRHLSVFLDAEDFTGTEYFQAVEKNLRGSKKLIVLCSPAARQSQYVNDEIRRFVQARGTNAVHDIIPILVAGLPNNEAEKAGLEDEKAFPEELCKAMEMPLAADYRRCNPAKDKLNRGAYSGDWYKILADLYEVSRSDIEQRERKRLARSRRIMFSIAGGLIALLSTALVVTLFSRQQAVAARKSEAEQRAEAEKQRDEAERVAYIASMNLASSEFRDGHTLRSLELLDFFLPASDAAPRPNDVRNFYWYYLWRQTHREQATLRGHTAAVKAVRFSPDGRKLLSVGTDWTLKLWDVQSGQEAPALAKIPINPDYFETLEKVAFSPDLRLLAMRTADLSGVTLWDLSSGKSVADLKIKQDITAVSFSLDGRLLAVADLGGHFTVWDVQNKSQASALEMTGPGYIINSVRVSPDGRKLAYMAEQKANLGLTLIDLDSNEQVPLKGAADIPAVFSPDGQMVASAGLDGKVRLWSATSREVIATLAASPRINALAFSPDGETLVTGDSEGKLNLWDVRSQKRLGSLTGHRASVESVAFSPDGQTLASGSEDQTVKLWNKQNTQAEATLVKTSKPVGSVAFSPDGRVLASVGDRKVTLRDTRNGKEAGSFPANGQQPFAFSPDGRMLATTTGNDGKSLGDAVKLWDVQSGKELATLRGHTHFIQALAFSPDSRVLASAGIDTTVKLWEAQSGREIATLKGHQDWVNSVAFSPDGKILASASGSYVDELEVAKGFAEKSKDTTIKLWDVQSGHEIATLKGHEYTVSSVAFSPDGKMLASVSDDQTLKLWDVQTRKELATLKGHLSAINSVAFSPDGRLLATASGRYEKGVDDTVKLWDVRSRKELATLRGYQAGVRSVAFSPDGKTLASASFEDKTIRLWQGAREEEVVAQRAK